MTSVSPQSMDFDADARPADTLPDQAVIVLDGSGNLHDINPAAVALLGYSAADLHGRPAHDLLGPEPSQSEMTPAQIWQPGEARLVVLRHRDGHPIPVQLSVSLFDLAGQPWRICVAAQIDDPAADETETVRHIGPLELALQTAKLGVWVLDIESNQLTWNDELFEIYGQHRAEFEENLDAWRQQVHPDDLAYADSRVEEVFEGKTVYDVNFRVIRPNGEIRHVNASATPIYDNQGTIVKLMGINRDVTEEQIRKEQLLFHTHLANSIGEATIATDLAGKIIFWNRAAEQIYGWRAEEVMGKSIVDVTPTDTSTAEATTIMQLLLQGKTWSGEFSVRHKDGTIFPASVTDAPLTDADGELIGIIGISRDISELKAVAQALSQSEALYHSIVDALSDGLVVQDRSDTVIMANDAAARILGLSMEQLLGKSSYDPRWQAKAEDGSPFRPEEHPSVVALRTGKPVFGTIMRVFIGDHTHAIISINSQPIFEHPGEITGTVTTFADITELKTSEDLFRAFFAENVSPVYWVEMRNPVPVDLPIAEQVDAIFREAYIKDVSDTIAQMYGFANREAVIGKPLSAIYGDDVFDHDSATRRSYLTWVKSGYRSITSEAPELTQAGEIRWAVSNTKGVIENGQLIRIWGSQIDITERKRAEERLISLSKAIEQSPVSVVITDAAGTIQYVNPKFCQTTGYTLDEAIGQNPRILQSGKQSREFYAKMWGTLASGEEWQGEFHNKRKDGSFFWELASIAPVRDDQGTITHYVAVKEEITERKRIEKEIGRQERLASVGQLAAGIAHDFNNILAAITLYVQMIGRTDPISPKDRERLDVINQQAWHASRLVQQILDFSRKGILQRHPLDLLPLFKEHIRLLTRTLPENILIDLAHDNNELTVNADPTRMQQILTNLAVNARDAMPEGGQLKISLSQITVDSDAASPHPSVGQGTWVQWIVSDTGVGIPADILPQIFDPFFTTKGPGEGSGLGLAQVHGIVGQHGGHISVESVPDQGTTFTIHLPALLQTTAPMPQSSTKTPAPRGNGEQILVVEDEAVLRRAIVAILEEWNYRTLEARHGEEALALLAEHNGEIALVVSDVVMPIMGGVGLLRALEQSDLHVPVILISGHPMNKTKGGLPKRRPIAWLTKPLNLDDLAQSIQAALNK